MTFELRRLGPDDAATFRALRLEGLQRHPCAFATSGDEEAALGRAEVAARLRRHAVIGAFVDGALVGIAGFLRPTHAKKRHKGILWGVYVRA